MKLLPTKRQWKEWTLPSRISYIGFVLGILSLGFSLAFYYWPQTPDTTSDQPQLSVLFTAKPYLRYSTPPGSGIELSYEICVRNSGRHPAKNLRYLKGTQTLQTGPDISITVDSLPSLRAPDRLAASDHYCQILQMRNPALSTEQIGRFIERYNSGDAAIVLELEIRYSDAFTKKQYFFEERNKIKKDRVDIL